MHGLQFACIWLRAVKLDAKYLMLLLYTDVMKWENGWNTAIDLLTLPYKKDNSTEVFHTWKEFRTLGCKEGQSNYVLWKSAHFEKNKTKQKTTVKNNFHLGGFRPPLLFHWKEEPFVQE